MYKNLYAYVTVCMSKNFYAMGAVDVGDKFYHKSTIKPPGACSISDLREGGLIEGGGSLERGRIHKIK